ncbi:hypothetical protein DFH06DRAFT_1247868 [Mycena polygramma]|nr:hypothetical protein DFH06DRAFT_1247868 [Mycena polygramma]
MNNTNTLKQVDGLWFSDDTLILRAEDSIFRVTKSILAARSPVFQALFDFPQPATDEDDVMEGRPLVRLHDSAADVEAFLRAIFDSSFFMPPPATASFHEALGILRLAHKYDVAYLYKRACLHLEAIYPLDLSSVPHQAREIHSRYPDYLSGNVALDFKAITIFHEVGASWLLPYAHYRIGTCKFDEYLATGEAWTQLPIDIQHTCIRLYALHVRGTARINGCLVDPSDCRITLCRNIKHEIVVGRLVHRQLNHDPLREWREHQWALLKGEMCDDCLIAARASHDLELAKLWDELPSNCGMAGWDMLREARKAAFE